MNVSPATLLTPGCTQLLAGLPLPHILLELSEHDPVADYDALKAVLAPLRAAGMRLAIDDVGAGFSCLRHIVLTTPDVIKLDRSIVDTVSTDPVLSTLVRSLTEFGHGCGAQVVAEGIEPAADAAALTELGVDYGQGWHYGRPGPATDLAGNSETTTSPGRSRPEPGLPPARRRHTPAHRPARSQQGQRRTARRVLRQVVANNQPGSVRSWRDQPAKSAACTQSACPGSAWQVLAGPLLAIMLTSVPTVI